MLWAKYIHGGKDAGSTLPGMNTVTRGKGRHEPTAGSKRGMCYCLGVGNDNFGVSLYTSCLSILKHL